jgi:outer membrane immunogenic protein
MKKLFFANAALAALIAAPAMAADMPIVAPPVYKAPFSWSGCYGGFNAGYIGTLDRYDNSPSGAYSTIFTSAQIAQGQTSYRPDGSSYTGGVQFGCNYQWGGAVWGVEGDFNGSGLDETALVAVPANDTWADRTETQSRKLPWFSTIRGRLGIAPLDGWLFYATGGLAIAQVRSDFSFLASDLNAHVGSTSTTRTGWTAGAGVEWTVAANWSMKFEYLYLDFGTSSFLSPNTSLFGGPADPTFTWTNNVRTREQVVRVGINYKLGPSFANY